MSLDVDDLLGRLTDAARTAFAAWDDIAAYAGPELEALADRLAEIAEGLAEGFYTEESAKVLVRMQLRSAQIAITASTGVALIDVQKALDAVIAAVRDFVNGKLPVPLL